MNGKASALPSSPNGLKLWKWIGAERGGRGRGEQRRYHHAQDRGPKRAERPGQRVGRARDAPFFPALGEGDQRCDGAKRHLEARTEQRVRLAQQHDDRRQSEIAHAERRPVDQGRAEDDQRHDQRAHGGNFGAGEEAIGRRAGHGRDRGDLLDRPAQGERPRQRQERAHQPEDGAGCEHHMQPGYRDDVVNAGGAQVVIGRLGDQPALAGDQRRRHRARLPAAGLGDAFGQGVAGLVDRRQHGEIGGHGWRIGCRDQLSWNAADGADPLEEGVAAEIIATGTRRAGRRQQPRQHRDMLPRHSLGAARIDPHAARLPVAGQAGHIRDPDHQPRADIARLDRFDEAGETPDPRSLQHRRRDLRRPPCCGGKAGCAGGDADAGEAQARPASQHQGGKRGEATTHQWRPEHRLAVGSEIEQDADAHGQRQPEEQAAPLDLRRQRPRQALAPGFQPERGEMGQPAGHGGAACRQDSGQGGLPAGRTRRGRLHQKAPLPPRRLRLNAGSAAMLQGARGGCHARSALPPNLAPGRFALRPELEFFCP